MTLACSMQSNLFASIRSIQHNNFSFIFADFRLPSTRFPLDFYFATIRAFLNAHFQPHICISICRTEHASFDFYSCHWFKVDKSAPCSQWIAPASIVVHFLAQPTPAKSIWCDGGQRNRWTHYLSMSWANRRLFVGAVEWKSRAHRWLITVFVIQMR